MSGKHGTPIERFWSKVDIRGENECWPWLAGGDADGYGVFYLESPRKYIRASAFAYFTVHGTFPMHYACHTCNNPPCCNPKHIYDGTNQENQIQAVRDGLRSSRIGECNPKARITNEIAISIWNRLQSGERSAAIARSLNIHVQIVCGIKNGYTWTKITGRAK